MSQKASYFADFCNLFSKQPRDPSNSSRKKSLSLRTKRQSRPATMVRSSSSLTTIESVKYGGDDIFFEGPILEDSSESDESESEYCMIDNFSSISFEKLALAKGLSLCYSGRIQDLELDFDIISTLTKQVCHQFDKDGKAIQFAETNGVTGRKSKEIILFIRNRYHEDATVGDSRIAFMALLMLGVQVLKTESEVKGELLKKTQIGCYIVHNMIHVMQELKLASSTFKPSSNLISILLDSSAAEDMEYPTCLIEKLRSTVTKFNQKAELGKDHNKVIDMANKLFST